MYKERERGRERVHIYENASRPRRACRGRGRMSSPLPQSLQSLERRLTLRRELFIALFIGTNKQQTDSPKKLRIHLYPWI